MEEIRVVQFFRNWTILPLSRRETQQMMKRTLILTFLVILLAAACAPAPSGQQAEAEVTVFRPPT